MPSKLRKAIGAVKDQTSISLAKVSGTNSTTALGVCILKATTHEEVPMEDRHVQEILQCVSSNKAYAAACAQAISKRINRTRNWVVAVKSLMLILRIFQQGDPYFPREVLHASKRGSKLLNLSSFKDDSNSSPWDFTAFVRTFALYLDERLDCLANFHRRDTNPAILLDRISSFQRLLDRAIASQPTGAAKTNRLVQIAVHEIVRESFDLYRDISDGLALLLDSFFHLQYQSCVNAFQACIKASKQYEDLSSFYSLCKSLGIGRSSEYPSVQKVSDELIHTLQEFLKDQSSFPTGSKCSFLPRSVTECEPSETLEPADYNSTRDPEVESFDLRIGQIATTSTSSISVSNSDNENLEEHGECWELALLETADQDVDHDLFPETSIANHQNNPFLVPEDLLDIELSCRVPAEETPDVASDLSLTVAPTFSVSNPDRKLSQVENDPFETSISAAEDRMRDGSASEQTLWQEQKLWLQNQNKIIANRLSRFEENQ